MPIGSGRRTRTSGLLGMNQLSYHCSIPRYCHLSFACMYYTMQNIKSQQ